MSDVIPVSVEWLTLREDADSRARSSQLARTAARMSQPPIVVHDLGSGTGSMMRWLAPMLPGPQTWVLHDWNSALLDHAAERALDSTGHDAEVRTSVKDVAHLREGDLTGGSLVTMSALLDVLSLEEAHAVVSACIAAGVPALFTLSVTGEVVVDPVDPGDRMFESAFNDHQRRTVDGRRLLGPDAVTMVVDADRGIAVGTRRRPPSAHRGMARWMARRGRGGAPGAAGVGRGVPADATRTAGGGSTQGRRPASGCARVAAVIAAA
jgi:hypothetical protein